jgi:hypothetical protein
MLDRSTIDFCMQQSFLGDDAQKLGLCQVWAFVAPGRAVEPIFMEITTFFNFLPAIIQGMSRPVRVAADVRA